MLKGSQEVSAHPFTAALCTIAKKWEEPKCPLMDG